LNVLLTPFTRWGFYTTSNFDNSAVEQQRGSSKKKGNSSDCQTQKKAAGIKPSSKAHVESSEGEDELEDTSSSENDRSSLQGKMRTIKTTILYNQQNYISYRGICKMQQEGLPVYIQTKGF